MQRGFTLIEVVIVLAIAGILAAISYPNYSASLRKARRADAISHLARLQQRQENWRANHSRYARSADLGIPKEGHDSAGKFYVLWVSSADKSGYVAIAEARGAQLDDGNCRFMRLTSAGGNTLRASGRDSAADNDAATNAQCWLQ